MEQERLYDLWSNRNPYWESRYENSILRVFSDYGKGTTVLQEERGKIYGAAYEVLSIAFFLGLYNNQRRPLVADASKRKPLGQPIKFWGNVDSKPGRVAYPKLRTYIFAALVARTDIDFIALDKGELSPKKVVDMLMTTMEEYINWGLHYIAEMLEDNHGCLFKETAFLNIFLDCTLGNTVQSGADEVPEALD